MLNRHFPLLAASLAVCTLGWTALFATSDAHGAVVEKVGQSGTGTRTGVADKALKADPLTISLATGGRQVFSIDFGPSRAGAKFLIGGSKRGTVPGTRYGDVMVPLNFDAYSDVLLKSLGTPKFKTFEGKLDAQGKATAHLDVPISADPGLVGMVIFHAVVARDAKTGELLEASNAVELILMP